MTTTNDTTAHALELARELREHDAKLVSPPWCVSSSGEIGDILDGDGHWMACAIDWDDAESIIYLRNHAADIALTLDALVSENAKLRGLVGLMWGNMGRDSKWAMPDGIEHEVESVLAAQRQLAYQLAASVGQSESEVGTC